MIDKVFAISGNKISSFIIDENSLKFSSQNFNTFTAFQDAWNKKLSFATKVEVKYDSIKSIKKEENDDDVYITYKAIGGISVDCVFSFKDQNEDEVLFNYFIREHFYQKVDEVLSPFKAIQNYLIGLFATIGVTVFSYFEVIGITNGTVEEAHSRNTRQFNNIIELLGDKGVILVGTGVSLFLLYKIWTRYKNPPNQIKFLPPNR
jgi:hypothetical protein